ncbi:MAG: hypothetical protein AUJ49_04385 [Desulfovibrionaceae bacterium CG1_02_65_16]|nr:MAG: hypothetical protein AUJ49_04385 [Desulfovibrionaceae bacterium CG1_02_65_16]
MSDFPRTLFVETTTRCNLTCPMCVKNAPGWRGGEGHMAWTTFEHLEPALPHAGAVVLNGTGEPLLQPELPRMIARAKALQPKDGWCGLQTNGLLLNAARARELVRAGLDVLCLSVDGEAASFGHGAGQGGAVDRAVSLVRNAARECGRSLRLGAEFVLMRSNAAELPGLVDWAAALGLDFLLVTHMLPVAPAQEAEALFHPCSRAAIAFFAHYQPQADTLGFSFSELARIAMKYNRSADEEKLLDLAREMRQNAQARGIWLDVERLARTDFAQLDELAELFAQAGKRAAAAGLDLRLPGLAAPDADRRCAFVDGGAACIDWLGNVSPCQFLWHGYACSLYGEAKRVHPIQFGNICATPLAEIWRAPEFRVFRDQARAGEFPPCGDCATGLCSDIRGDAPFERDCLGLGVPCGHCPWAVGQLMCLGTELNVSTR